LTHRLTYADIGRALGGISRQAVHKLVKRGMPTASIEAARQWHLANVDPFRQAIDAPQPAGAAAGASPTPAAAPEQAGSEPTAPEDVSLRQARTRQANAAAELAELELQERRGDLISLRGAVLPAIEDLVLRIGSELENLPARAAPQLLGAKDAWHAEQILKAEATQIRERVRLLYLAQSQSLQGQGGGEDDDDEA
jgi:hypothetical protein